MPSWIAFQSVSTPFAAVWDNGLRPKRVHIVNPLYYLVVSLKEEVFRVEDCDWLLKHFFGKPFPVGCSNVFHGIAF
ncbi:hypothetical protein [Flavobacterium sp. ZS1P14]|uniref:hypothetical protein n=1 Tax=Flavobacterium sp. ZS1P14 TaxID=3401729 RepID=UPI003AADECF2